MGAFGRRVVAGTFDFGNGMISYVELPIVGEMRSEVLVADDGQIVPLSELDAPGSDCVVAVLALGEVVTPEMKSELEERLRMRMARAGLVHPNVPLKEKTPA